MVEAALLRVEDEGHVVGLHAQAEELGDARAAIEHLFGEGEAEHLGEQAQGLVELVAVQQAMVETHRAHALEAARPGFRVDLGEAPLAGDLLLREQLEAVPGR
ncbi:hypothetical protein D9M68_901910 [compost metagenome]